MPTLSELVNAGARPAESSPADGFDLTPPQPAAQPPAAPQYLPMSALVRAGAQPVTRQQVADYLNPGLASQNLIGPLTPYPQELRDEDNAGYYGMQEPARQARDTVGPLPPLTQYLRDQIDPSMGEIMPGRHRQPTLSPLTDDDYRRLLALQTGVFTPAPPPAGMIPEPAPEPPAPPPQSLMQDLRNVPANVGAAVARGLGGAAQAIGTAAQYPGKVVRQMGSMFPGNPGYDRAVQTLNAPARAAGQFAQRQGGYLTEGAAQTEQDLPVRGEVGKLAVGLGTLGVDAAVGAVTGGAGFTASFATRAGGTMYDQAIRQGDDPGTATQKAVVAAFTAALTPELAHVAPAEAGQAIAEQAARAYLGTGSMVAAQSTLDELTLKAGTNQPIDLSRVLPEAAVQGLVGVGMHAMGPVGERLRSAELPVHPMARAQTAEPGLTRPASMETPGAQAGDYGGVQARRPSEPAPVRFGLVGGEDGESRGGFGGEAGVDPFARASPAADVRRTSADIGGQPEAAGHPPVTELSPKGEAQPEPPPSVGGDATRGVAGATPDVAPGATGNVAPVAAPAQPEATPTPAAGAKHELDFKGAFTMGEGGVTGTFIDSMWERVQRGEPIPRMGPIENQLRDAQKAGQLKTRQDVEEIVRGGPQATEAEPDAETPPSPAQAAPEAARTQAPVVEPASPEAPASPPIETRAEPIPEPPPAETRATEDVAPPSTPAPPVNVADKSPVATPKPPPGPKPAPAKERKPLEDQLRHVVATSAEFHDDLLHQRAHTDPGESNRQRGFQKSVTVGQRVAQGNLDPKALVSLERARELARTLPPDHPAQVVLRKLEALEAGDRDQGPSSIKNAEVDQERERRGIAPAEQAARRSFGEVWDNAQRDLEDNPELARDLVDRLKSSPRALTDHEDALLLSHQITLQNEHRRVAERIVKEGEANGPEMPALRARLAGLSDQLLDVYNVGKASGTETGRGLNARRMMARQDFSLAAMETVKRAEKGGAALTAQEREQLVALHQKIEETQRAFDEHVSKSQEREAELHSKLNHARLLAEEQRQATAATAKASKSPEAAPRRRITATVADRLIKAGDEAGERLRQKFAGRLNDVTGLVEALPDVTVWATGQLAKLTRATGKKAAELYNALRQRAINLVGEEITPHFQRVFDEAVRAHEEAAAAPAAAKERAPAPSILEKVKESAGDPAAVGRYVQKLAREKVAEGVKEREPLIDAVHKEVAPLLGEGWSRADTRDAISGYGDYKQLSKDEVSVKLRELKGEMQQVAKLEDMAQGQAPKKTGVERREPSFAERRLIKEVNDAKRRLGIQTTDPETQLKSTLDAIKTSLDHRIADAEYELASGRRDDTTRTPTPADAEVEAKRAKLADLRQVRDAVFGKATDDGGATEQRLQEQVSRLNAELAGAVEAAPPRKAGEPEPANVTALRERVRALQAEKRGGEAQRVKTLTGALERQIAEAEQQVNEAKRGGTWSPADAPPDAPRSAVIDALTARRDALRAELGALVAASPEHQADQRERVETARTLTMEKAVANLDRRIKAGEIAGPGKTATVDTQAQAALRARRDRLAKDLADLRKAARPKLSPEEITLKVWKANTARRISDLADRIAREDYSPSPARKPMALDEVGLRLKAENERMKLEFHRGLLRDRLKRRTMAEKVQDTFVKWRRAFLLSSPVTLAKLTSAAAERTVFTPIEELLGGGISKAFPGLAERAPREGGFSTRAEARAITEGFTRGMKDARDILATGKSNLDMVHGKGDDGMPPALVDFIGHVHGALKSTTKRNEFARSFQKRVEHAIRNGIDPTDPAVQLRIAKDAYVDANRSIFMQDNRVVEAYKHGLRLLKAADKTTGRPRPGARAIATGLETLLPIVKVPTNVVAETFQYALGIVPGAARLAQAYAHGIKTLPEAEADSIMRLLKKGSIGAAVMALGYFGAADVGGYYQPGQKRDEKDVPAGGVRLFGHDVPRYLVHNPLLETLQIGATIRRVADAKHKKTDAEGQGLGAGVTAAAMGLTEEVPFVRTPLELAKVYDPAQRDQAIGRTAESLAVPEAVGFAARHLDQKDAQGEPVKRRPKGVLENVEMGIPGLRQRVPLATGTLERQTAPATTTTQAREGPLAGLKVEDAIPVFQRLTPAEKQKYRGAMLIKIARSSVSPADKDRLRQMIR